MERIVFKYLYNFLRENFIISVHQSGFLPGRSTITQLLDVYNTFCTALDSGKEIRVVFLDISKAFDKVWHKGLLCKLRSAGVSGRLLAWLANYLKDRVQRVVVNGQTSDWKDIGAGVPQGSVLGPLLFLLYINDLVQTVSNSQIKMFADDTCLFVEVDNRDTTAGKLNENLGDIDQWAHKWLVNFSAAKTKSLIISNKRDRMLNPGLTFGGLPIEEVNNYTYLGLNISFNLRWNVHIDKIATKARKRLNAVTPLKFKLDKRSLEIIYLSFILPTMEYGNIVWGGTYDSDLAKLERIQVDALRLITGATARSNISKLYDECSIRTFKQRVEGASICMMYKIIYGIAPKYLQDILTTYRNHPIGYILRYRADHVSPFTKQISRNSFFHIGISLWENLPENARIKPSLNSFKSHLKKDYPKRNIRYYYGSRWPQVHHARLRMGCSKLHDDLANKLHVIDNPACDCGYHCENVQHFFMECNRYDRQRRTLFLKVSVVCQPTVQVLLHGDADLSAGQNGLILDAVHEYLTASDRFS
jgi:hypothetical protein